MPFAGEANGGAPQTSPPEDAYVWDHSHVQQYIGGNSLDSAAPSRVADFVRSRGGHTVITKVSLHPFPFENKRNES
jgi:acetyl-CoA carboxylase/biotin carboxylase 1